jgi:hypothetical protein
MRDRVRKRIHAIDLAMAGESPVTLIDLGIPSFEVEIRLPIKQLLEAPFSSDGLNPDANDPLCSPLNVFTTCRAS